MKRSVVLHIIVFWSVLLFLAPLSMAADSLSSVNIASQKAELTASAGAEKVKYFTLDSPKRLVVDMYGVQPGPHSNNFALSQGFKSLRVGPYEDKTRFVFDVSGEEFPVFQVNIEDGGVEVSWQPVEEVNRQVLAEPATSGRAQVTAIDFKAEAGKSILDISLNRDAKLKSPTQNGNKVTFALENATLPQALRREFDTFAFPTVIQSVVPYMVNVAGQQEVRFVVELKGDAAYTIEKQVTGYSFIVDDGLFATATKPVTGIFPVAADAQSSTLNELQPEVSAELESTGLTASPVIEQAGDDPKYTGAKTSLVFDNADVRDILRLIAEISNLNIIASDEVEGNVTLRLIDVPWDQALDLILDVTNLKMVKKGNVVRVLPLDTYNKMKEAELASLRSQEKLEPLLTDVITVSYADLGSVSEPIKKILSERGSLTEDSRNKLLIINDVQDRIDKARNLISILDTPERQVLIEARIIEVSTEYSRDLGVNWGLSYDNNNDGTLLNSLGVSAGGEFIVADVLAPVGGIGSSFRFGETLLDNTVLDLRISALESNSKLKVISTPKVTTLNGEKATIKQGTDIPYQTVEDGEVKIEFKEAVLELTVTPVINPDGSIILEIEAKNDSLLPESGGALTRKQANTKVLVMDGETTVLGGVFIDREGDGDAGVPFLRSIPGIGKLFQSTADENSKDELLIFITPRILAER
jgi:type IV pilus assembly protein PilQ